MIKIYSDAAYKAQTKEAGIGVQIISGDQRIQNKVYISKAFDNHWAEFLALISALNYLSNNFDLDQPILFYSDSKILIDSIEKGYSGHAEYKQPLSYILDKLESLDLFFPKWIPESENKGADNLAKQALRLEGKLYKVMKADPINFFDL